MKEYKTLSILGIISALMPNLMAYSDVDIYWSLFVGMWIVASIFGVVCTFVFLKNIKAIRIYWLIPAVFSVILSIGFLFSNNV